MNANPSPIDPGGGVPAFDSDEFDRLIRAERATHTTDAKRAVPGNNAKRTYSGEGRGAATDEDLQRRAEADRAIRRSLRKGEPTPEHLSAVRKLARAQRADTVRWPQPKPLPNGRWKAKCIHNGRFYSSTFDTEQEAREFIQRVKES